MSRASDFVELAIKQAEDIITLSDGDGRRVMIQLKALLRRADKDLSTRLVGIGAETARFTDLSRAQYRAQIRIVTEYVRLRLSGLTGSAAQRAVGLGFTSIIRDIERLDLIHTGAVRPLRLRQASVIGPAVRSASTSLLRTHQASIARWGISQITRMEKLMQVGITQGASQRDVREAIIKKGFSGERWEAERIVRTETARAYNLGRFESMRVSRETVKKLILATFDNRTAQDSMAVHGQIREMGEEFEDGEGRRYLYPPARPNDRETVIPWRDEWELPSGFLPKGT